MSKDFKEAKYSEVRDAHAAEIKSMSSAFKKLEDSMTKLWNKAAAYAEEEVYRAGPAGADNIIGVGHGKRIKGGKRTREICLKAYVVEKYPEDEIQADALIPKEIDGVPIDVEAVGEIVALGGNRKAKWRPAPGGVSIGHVKITAGTLGCFCGSKDPLEPLLILSNNHVLANENNAHIGDPIVQPGPYDGGRDPRDRIATLFDFVPIDFTGEPNLVDAALAKPTSKELIKLCILESPSKCSKQGCVKVTGAAPPVLGAKVKKSGRTTATTCGAVTGVGATINVGYGGGKVAKFVNQIVITPAGFSAGGDSGSLIMDMRNRARALLFAGSSTHTIANPINFVLAELSKAPRVLSGLQILDC
jgi:hypothetical protein